MASCEYNKAIYLLEIWHGFENQHPGLINVSRTFHSLGSTWHQRGETAIERDHIHHPTSMEIKIFSIYFQMQKCPLFPFPISVHEYRWCLNATK